MKKTITLLIVFLSFNVFAKPSDVILPVIKRANKTCALLCGKTGKKNYKHCKRACMPINVDKQMHAFDFVQMIGREVCVAKKNKSVCVLIDRCVRQTRDEFGFNWSTSAKCFAVLMMKKIKKDKEKNKKNLNPQQSEKKI